MPWYSVEVIKAKLDALEKHYTEDRQLWLETMNRARSELLIVRSHLLLNNGDAQTLHGVDKALAAIEELL